MSVRGRTWLWMGIAGAGLIALAVAFVTRGTADEDAAVTNTAVAPDPAPERSAPDRALPIVPAPLKQTPPGAPGGGRETLAQAQARLERAEETLKRYRESTKYPPTSRPLSEEPDRVRLHEPAERTHPLNKDSSTLLTLGQDRTFLTADESARLWVRCATQTGASVSCRVDGARVSVVNEDGAEPVERSAAVVFRDDGLGGDDAADDGTWTAQLQPKAAGLGDVVGTLRVDLAVTDSRDVAHPFFTLVTTGDVPATFTRQVTESIVNGSLGLAVGLSVKKAGRYVVHGRVEDAQGKPVAWLEFNDTLTQGEHAVPLVVFGKLIRDLHPAFPLTLRDVDGFLLLEDAYPDRQLVPALEGAVHKTGLYREDQFSDAEWTSEQRDRYLQEFEQQVERAQAAVDQAKP